MTDTEARSIAKSERERLLGLLPTIDPLREKEVYRMTLENISSLNWLIPPEAPALTIGEAIPVTDVHPIDNVIPFPEPSAEEYEPPVMEAPEPDPKPEPEEAPTYTKEEVRAELARARKKGINVTDLLKKFGVDNFSALPAAKYTDMVNEILLATASLPGGN